MKPYTGVAVESVTSRPSVPTISLRSSIPPFADHDASVIEMPPLANLISATALSSPVVLSAWLSVAPQANTSVAGTSLPKK